MSVDYTADQIGLEELSQAAANARDIARLHSAVAAGDALALTGVADQIRASLPAVSASLRDLIADAAGFAQAVKARELRECLGRVDPDVLALIGLNTLFAVSVREGGLLWAQTTIGRAVAVECHAALARECSPKAVARLVKGATARGTRGRSAAVTALGRIIKAHGEDPMEWDEEAYLSIAAPITAACEATGLFQIVDRSDTGEGILVTLQEAAAEALREAQADSSAWSRPRLLPMVTEPAPWDNPEHGPYLTEQARMWLKVLRRTRGPARTKVKAEWSSITMRPFRGALDALGRAPFVIDANTLDLAEWAYATLPGTPGGLPARPLEDIGEPPEKLSDADKQGLSEAERDRYGLEWSRFLEAREHNTLGNLLGAELRSDLGSLRLLGAYPAVYQPHYSDFRGRLYPASALSHHRPDYIRAAFRFRDSTPLGDHGRKWLAVHIANSAAGEAYGKLDKASLAERVGWVERSGDLLRRVGSEPRECPELWATCDAPFAFVQAAREWSRMLDAGGDGRGYECGIAAPLDGTCSGLQHYAAALRSEGEGRLVNLTAADRPSDVYAAVAERVVEILKDYVTASGGEDDDTGRIAAAAQQWLDFGVIRSTVKRQVMTFPYSSEAYGFAEQLRADIMRPIKRQLVSGELSEHPFGDDDGAWKASTTLAKAIWEALGGVVVAAAQGMEWIKDTASLMAKHGQPLVWRTPSGFPVVHSYRESKGQRVATFLGQRRLKLVVQKETRKLLPHKQRSAAAPNVIHSMDAAHLHLTASRMAREGVSQLAMIHDSFATVPGHTEKLARVLREEFVSMYENYCPFTAIHEHCLSVLPPEGLEKLRDVPRKGQLDIRSVLSSDYFFC